MQSPIFSDLGRKHIDYPDWLDELFLRFTAIYRGKWTYSLEDERMLELTRFEWHEKLKKYDAEIIREATSEAAGTYKDVPSIAEFLEIAKIKMRRRTERYEAEKRERIPKLERKADSKIALDARENIRELVKKMKRGGF